MKKFSILLLFILSAPIFALQLLDSDNFVYDLGANGALMQGTQASYAEMYYLRVNGTNYIGDISHLSSDGRKVTFETFVEPNTQLEVKRTCYVAKTRNFARFMEILYNPTAEAISIDVEVYGRLGSGNETVALIDQPNFLITGDLKYSASGLKPVLVHYHSQVNNAVQATHILDNNHLSWVYANVTIPAQSKVRLIYFIAQTTNLQTATQIATQFYNNPSFLYEQISPVNYSTLLNFKPNKAISRDDNAENNFIGAPFLNLDELRTDSLTEEDDWSVQRVGTAADSYILNLEANKTVTIRLSAHFNTYLHLFDHNENLISQNDDRYPDTTHSTIIFTAPSNALYYVEVTSYDRYEYGDYSLEILAGATNQKPSIYAVEATANEFIAPTKVDFQHFSQDVDGEIVEQCWHFDDGSSVVCQNGETIAHTYQQAGQYNASLSIKDNQGAYAYYNLPISIKLAVEGAVLLRVKNTVEQELSASDNYAQLRPRAFADRYLINSATIGEELLIEMQSEDFDSYLYLYNQFNQLLSQNNNGGNDQHASLHYTPIQDEILWLEATSFDDNVLGQYKLSLILGNKTTDFPIEIVPVLNSPLKYQFVARMSPRFQANSWRWDFGDGSNIVTTDNSIVLHEYNQQRQFAVKVEAFNAEKEQLTAEQIFNIGNSTARIVNFVANPLFGESPLQVFFSNESMLDNSFKYIWHFGNGQVSTNSRPNYVFPQGGIYYPTLQAYSLTQNATYSLPIIVIDRNASKLPITGITREMPQVLMAGFDPMLIDILDTQVKIFAIVRAGGTPIQTVRFIMNNDEFGLILRHVATYGNGDQHYETVLDFTQGSLPVGTLANLFGTGTEQFKVQAIDQSGQSHAFPNLEIGHNPPITTAPKSLQIQANRHGSVHRYQPQVLAAGFDPIIMHKNEHIPRLTQASDTKFTIKAIVRAGAFPISKVTFMQNHGDLILPMHFMENLPNGDKIYVVSYNYSLTGIETATLVDLWGILPHQFTIVVEDLIQQQHRYPEVEIGDFAVR